MTHQEFKEKEEDIAKAIEAALWQAIKKCPQGFHQWLFGER